MSSIPPLPRPLTRVIFQNKTNSIPGAAIFSLHTLASHSGRNVNYEEKQLTWKQFLSCSFYLYRFREHVSYGFPMINFCNPGVHYETPCIKLCMTILHIQCVPLWSSSQSFWLLTQRSRVRSPALPDFLSSSGSGTGSTQPREPHEVN